MIRMTTRPLLTRFIILVFLFSGVSSVWAQQTNVLLINQNSHQQSEIPKRLARKFKRDAARLALRMEAEKEDLRYLNIAIPQSNIEDIYRVLTNIYKKDETARSITECNVHTFPNPSIDHFILIFERDIAWGRFIATGHY